MQYQQVCETIVKNLPIGFTVIDEDGVIINFNDSAEEITGYKREDIMGKSHLEIFHGTSDKNACPLLSHLLDLHKPIEVIESTIKKKDGNEIILLITAAPIFDHEGRFIGGVELFRDITAVKKLERERQYLLSALVHDMKNPITASLGFLSRIMAGKADQQKQKDYLELVIGELKTVEQLITNFLYFSRFEAKEMKLTQTPFNIIKAISQQIENMEVIAKEKNIRLITESPDHEVPEIVVDGSMIQRVIINLLDNAIKFTSSGGTIIVRLIDRAKDFVLEIRDTAVNIPRDQFPYIFEPFYHGVREQKGSGLGLFIAKKIVEAHGGQIWVRSADGKGNIFGFTLPK
ncbi:MAG: PAS domain S-box protein [Nitrospirae bacterium]|jgi:PAS domain S-box-containing protein|nr:PAS domain S-box protein [Nitrospirota bacterium]